MGQRDRVEVVMYQDGRGQPTPRETDAKRTVHRKPISLSLCSITLAELLFPGYMRASYRVGGNRK